MEIDTEMSLYGGRLSHTYRVVWALEELGLQYERDVRAEPEARRSLAYFNVNLSGNIPTLVEGDITLSESLAITIYLARRYGSHPFWPAGMRARSLVDQWSLWVATECEPLAVCLLTERVFRLEGKRDEAKATAAEEGLQRHVGMLDQHLGRSPFILGEAFSIADLNVASILTWAVAGKFPLVAHANASRWLSACEDRPSFKAASH